MTMTCERITGPASALVDPELSETGGAGAGDMREFQAEFESAAHVLDGTSTSRRPDAVSLDYLRAFSLGPVALGDDSEGIEDWIWYTRADAANIYIARRNVGNTGWDAETVLFAYTGAAIDELSLAFTIEGYPVVVMERATGTAGAPEVWFVWRDPVLLSYELVLVGSGRTPRVVSDKFAILPNCIVGVNRVLQSNSLATSPWTGVASVVGDVLASTADANNDNRQQDIVFVGDGAKTVSFDIQKGTAPKLLCELFDTSFGSRGAFILGLTGAAPVHESTPGTMTFHPIVGPDGLGFYRVSVTIVGIVAANTNSLRLTPSYTGAVGSTTRVRNVQFTDGTVVLPYTETTTVPVNILGECPDCGPPAYVQMIYLNPTDGLVRRAEDDDFATDLDIALPYDANQYLEKFFPTASRRLSVLYSERDIVTGQYEFKRIDTLPYPTELLKRPRFLIAFPGDVVWNQGEEFVSPTGSIIVTNNFLRAQTLDDVDGIQLQAASTDFSLATGWTEQHKDSIVDFPAGLGAGATYDFFLDITHGMGTMSPRAFRIRTYKDVQGETCYSDWEYYFAGKQAGNLVITDLGLVGNTRSFSVTSTDGDIHAIYWNGTMYVEGIFTSPQVFAVEEQLDINMIPRAAYSFGAQNVEHFTFIDDRGDSYDFDLYSKIAVSGAGTAPVFPPDFTPPGDPQFPYTFPPVPAIFGEVIGFPGWDTSSQEETAPSHMLPVPYVARYFDPVPVTGIEIDIESLELEFAGGAIESLASLLSLESQLTQNDVFGAMLLDRLELPERIIRTVEGCPPAILRSVDDTPAPFLGTAEETCCS